VLYDTVVKNACLNTENRFVLFPGVCPDWDNEARRTNRGFSLAGSTPDKYFEWLKFASETAVKAPTVDERIVFINAWNEWAEGAYLEPDLHYGCAYLARTLAVLEGLVGRYPLSSEWSGSSKRTPNQLKTPQPNHLTFLRNLPRLAIRKLLRDINARIGRAPSKH
jgi:hypothetical protein